MIHCCSLSHIETIQWLTGDFRRGCVSGSQLEHLRKNLATDNPNAPWDWDLMDGLEECSPEVQTKIKQAVIDGKIADEDFRGVSGQSVDVFIYMLTEIGPCIQCAWSEGHSSKNANEEGTEA